MLCATSARPTKVRTDHWQGRSSGTVIRPRQGGKPFRDSRAHFTGWRPHRWWCVALAQGYGEGERHHIATSNAPHRLTPLGWSAQDPVLRLVLTHFPGYLDDLERHPDRQVRLLDGLDADPP